MRRGGERQLGDAKTGKKKRRLGKSRLDGLFPSRTDARFGGDRGCREERVVTGTRGMCGAGVEHFRMTYLASVALGATRRAARAAAPNVVGGACMLIVALALIAFREKLAMDEDACETSDAEYGRRARCGAVDVNVRRGASNEAATTSRRALAGMKTTRERTRTKATTKLPEPALHCRFVPLSKSSVGTFICSCLKKPLKVKFCAGTENLMTCHVIRTRIYHGGPYPFLRVRAECAYAPRRVRRAHVLRGAHQRAVRRRGRGRTFIFRFPRRIRRDVLPELRRGRAGVQRRARCYPVRGCWRGGGGTQNRLVPDHGHGE